MSEDSNVDVGSAVVIEKEDLKDKEGDQPLSTQVMAPAPVQPPPYVFLEASS